MENLSWRCHGSAVGVSEIRKAWCVMAQPVTDLPSLNARGGVFAVFVKNHSWMLNEIVLDGQYYASFCLSPCVTPAYLFLSLVFSGVVFGENSWAPREWESVFPWEPVMLG